MDLVVQRITAEHTGPRLTVGTINFPDGKAPVPETPPAAITGPLPECDVIATAYTTAEATATADVLTPGIHHTQWAPYTHNWESLYEPHLTGRSPAREEKCMAHACMTRLNGLRVLCLKFELHLDTDDNTAPVIALVRQIVKETGCSLLITHGTAGGVGADTQLGDVIVAAGVKANMAHSQFENASWAQTRFPSPALDAGHTYQDMAFRSLIPAAIGDVLKPSGYAKRPPQLTLGRDCETVGYFAFADTADSYGVVANDPLAGVEEMDDVAVAVALAGTGVKWVSIRNASDPQMGGGSLASQKKAAEEIYEKYGYWTTVCSALEMWGLICDLSPAPGMPRVHLRRVEDIAGQVAAVQLEAVCRGPELGWSAWAVGYSQAAQEESGFLVGEGIAVGRSYDEALERAVAAYWPR